MAMRKLKKYKPTEFMAKDSHYDKAAADYAVMFIESLCHTKGTWAGKKFELIDWQEQIIRDVFGVLKPNGYRQFNTAYIEIPKKQGKSELAAAVALLLLCGDGEERAEVYGCAADRNQAKIVFDVALDMVRFSPALSKRVKILESQKKITFLPTNSSYQVLSADVANKHGFNTHGVIFDELHTQPNRKLFDVMLQGSGDARMQPLYFLITTAGNDTNSICYEVHQKALDIQAGRKIDPTFYSVIYGAAEDEDWTDPKVWKKANPSLGITVGIDKVKAACESAKQNPGEENSFRQLRLNQWVKQSVRWMPMDKWDACAFPVSEDDLEGRICYGGLDLSSTTDITAFVLVFPPTDDEDKYWVLPYFWVPEDTLDLRVKRDHVPYDLWERQGFVMTTEGNVIHYGFIEQFIERLGERFNIREIAFDRWGAVQMVQNLEGMSFTVVPFGQGFKDMSPPTKGKAGSAGTAAVVFSIYAPNGTVVQNQSGSLLLATSAYSGATAITTGTYQWAKYVGGEWVDISGATEATLTVSGAEIVNIQSYRCTMTYSSKNYVDVITVEDKSDPYVSEMLSIGGFTVKNSLGGLVPYVIVRTNRQEVDPLLGGISEVAPATLESGDYWYQINHSGKTVTLMKYDGTAWAAAAASDTQSLTYTWYAQDKDGNPITFNKTGKVIYIAAEDIDSILTLQCDVSN